MELKRPLRNLLSATGADLASRILGFVATTYLARTLGTSSFGTVSVGFSVLAYVILFSSPGLHIMGTRHVAGTTGNRTDWVSRLLSIRAMLATVGILLTGLIGLAVFGATQEWRTVFLFSCTALPLSFFLDWYFQGKEQISEIATSRIIMYAGYLVLILFLVADPGDGDWAAVSFFAGNCAGTVWLVSRFRGKEGRLRLTLNISDWRATVKSAIPLGLSSFLAQSMTNLPLLIVALLLTQHDTGLISAPLKLVFFLLMIDRVFSMLFFPVLTRHRKGGTDEFSRLVNLGLKVVAGVSVPVFVLGLFLAPAIVSIVFGGEYAASADLFRLLLPYVLFTTISTVLMSALYAADRETEYLKMVSIGTAVLLGLGIVLTLLRGIEGAAAGLSVAEAVIVILLFVRVRSLVPVRYGMVFLAPVAGGTVMAVALWLLSSDSPILMILFSLLVFSAVFVSLGGLNRKEMIYLKERFL